MCIRVRRRVDFVLFIKCDKKLFFCNDLSYTIDLDNVQNEEYQSVILKFVFMHKILWDTFYLYGDYLKNRILVNN